LASFLLIAIVMVSFGLAWGGFMQRPAVLTGLAAVVFAFALSLLGVFEIQLPGAATDAASAVAVRKGYAGAFFHGVMTTVLATPCVGPFLGTAIGVLATLPWHVAGSGIMVVGLGLASPYVLLTAFPAWLRYLPKPGPWMVTFKQIVGFILVFVVLWLLSILAQIVDTSRILGTLGLLGFVGVGCWVVGRITLSGSTRRAATLWIVALVLAAGGGWASFRVFGGGSSIPWQPWQPGLAERLAEEGYTVYVDYTATWCLICQSNKKLVLESDRVAQEFKQLGTYPVKADFTGYNPEIQKELQKYGRNGVPLNIVLPADHPGDAIVLPELLTPGMVLDAIRQAGPSRSKPGFWSAGR
jgi:thiol:disulfide interchange protein DsbD